MRRPVYPGRRARSMALLRRDADCRSPRTPRDVPASRLHAASTLLPQYMGHDRRTQLPPASAPCDAGRCDEREAVADTSLRHPLEVTVQAGGRAAAAGLPALARPDELSNLTDA